MAANAANADPTNGDATVGAIGRALEARRSADTHDEEAAPRHRGRFVDRCRWGRLPAWWS